MNMYACEANNGEYQDPGADDGWRSHISMPWPGYRTESTKRRDIDNTDQETMQKNDSKKQVEESKTLSMPLSSPSATQISDKRQAKH